MPESAASLKDRITADLKEAMKARDQLRLDTLRSAISAFTYRKVEAGKDLTNDEQVEVVRKLVKQRADAIAEYEKAGRLELAEKESKERAILAAFLPAAMSPEEIASVVREVVAALPAEQRAQGPAMKAALGRLRGKADGGEIRLAVEAALKA